MHSFLDPCKMVMQELSHAIAMRAPYMCCSSVLQAQILQALLLGQKWIKFLFMKAVLVSSRDKFNTVLFLEDKSVNSVIVPLRLASKSCLPGFLACNQK